MSSNAGHTTGWEEDCPQGVARRGDRPRHTRVRIAIARRLRQTSVKRNLIMEGRASLLALPSKRPWNARSRYFSRPGYRRLPACRHTTRCPCFGHTASTSPTFGEFPGAGGV